MHSQWQIDQAKKCPCHGYDDFCPCQNIDDSDPTEDEALPLVTSWVHQLLSDYDVSLETIKGDVELDQSIRDLIKTIRNKH